MNVFVDYLPIFLSVFLKIGFMTALFIFLLWAFKDYFHREPFIDELHLLNNETNAPHEQAALIDGVYIQVPTQYLPGMLALFNFFKKKSPKLHAWATNVITDISYERDNQVICSDPENRKIILNKQFFSCSYPFQTSIIFHEAYQTFKQLTDGDMAECEMEKQALAHQLKLLKRLGGSKKEVLALKSVIRDCVAG